MEHYHVVAAIIRKGDTFFCVRKGQTTYSYTSYKYEFPGGKVEPGELPRKALKREINEELKFKIGVGERLAIVDHAYPDFSITMEVFLCWSLKEEFVLTEHIDYAWLKVEDLYSVEWVAADVKVLGCLSRIQKLH